MTHFGIICPASTGHLNTMFPLGRELQRRGHCVTLLGILDLQAKAIAAGLEFQAIAESDSPLGSMEKIFAKIGELSGSAAIRFTVGALKNASVAILRDAPDAIKQVGIEALLVDQLCPAGGTVAEYLGIPFITVCSAVVMNQEDGVPPWFKVWSYNPGWWARVRNQISHSAMNRIAKPIQEPIIEYRQRWNLPQHSNRSDAYSKLAIISQQPAEFEFPRRNLPPYFHFTGPYHDSTGRPGVDFPFEKLNGKPLIYASMGTLQNRLQSVFQTIAEACVGLDAQLVISLGGALEPEGLKLSGEPLVVKYAPQLELLQKASLVITHAGLNTTLESLKNAVPMVAIPVTNDQPGVAARIAWTGAGELVPLDKLSVPKLRDAISRVLTQESYKQNAVRLQEAIASAGGVSRAIDIVENAISTGKAIIQSA
ncbi:MAG: glycosyltransferase [Cyanomargarita calcarea GSE-NOS-MK-12-04C]|jgi:MGT family glycosyltransferase|uniref:Glycosyltransferase n=1 Tax=Cyanomargarita calcarea GSE-NOS-MK-12-04C TaxID=2839659 RepID=A0A951UWY9_9CYAN|nr:glycosyltransferase [Cyanomargarita calcarea GSE-NOS-MK-12-04C]